MSWSAWTWTSSVGGFVSDWCREPGLCFVHVEERADFTGNRKPLSHSGHSKRSCVDDYERPACIPALRRVTFDKIDHSMDVIRGRRARDSGAIKEKAKSAFELRVAKNLLHRGRPLIKCRLHTIRHMDAPLCLDNFVYERDFHLSLRAPIAQWPTVRNLKFACDQADPVRRDPHQHLTFGLVMGKPTRSNRFLLGRSQERTALQLPKRGNGSSSCVL
jgi:hypothetical protein